MVGIIPVNWLFTAKQKCWPDTDLLGHAKNELKNDCAPL